HLCGHRTCELWRRCANRSYRSRSSPDRSQRALSQVPGEPLAVEPLGGNIVAAGLGLVMGWDRIAARHPDYGGDEDYLRPRGVFKALWRVAGRVEPDL